MKGQQAGQQGAYALSHAAIALVDDGCDSFDEDLGWILENLNERAGGSFGLILRFVEGVAQPALMARSASAADLSDNVIAQIAAELRHRVASQSPEEVPELAVTTLVTLQGLTDGCMRLLHLTFRPAPGVHIVAVVCRPDASSAMLHRMIARRLHPVLARYIRLWWMHRTERRRASAFENAVDLAELGIALLDRRGQLLYANAYVRKILEESDGLRRMGKALLTTDSTDSLRLQTAIQHALLCNVVCDPDASWQAPLIQVQRGETRRALILTVLPHRARAVDPEDAAAIVYVLHPERDVRKCLAPIYRIYGLTPAESRLVTELVKGASLLEAATGMNLTLPTVRAQLKQVFDKTRTNRQAELVRVMLASAVRSSVSVDLTLVG